MDGYMYAIMDGIECTLGYLNFGMQQKAPTMAEVTKTAEVHFGKKGLMAKRVAAATVRDDRLMDEARRLECSEWRKVEAMIAEADTLEGVIKLHHIMISLKYGRICLNGARTENLKTVALREELFALTGDTYEALILGCLLLEQERKDKNGWICKTAKQLISDCMLSISETTMRRILRSLIEKGFVEERSNPANKWDKTFQYRANVFKTLAELKKMGYAW